MLYCICFNRSFRWWWHRTLRNFSTFPRQSVEGDRRSIFLERKLFRIMLFRGCGSECSLSRSCSRMRRLFGGYLGWKKVRFVCMHGRELIEGSLSSFHFQSRFYCWKLFLYDLWRGIRTTLASLMNVLCEEWWSLGIWLWDLCLSICISW